MSMSDPIQSAYEVFEAARLEYIARNDHANAVAGEVDVELAPESRCLWTGASTPAEEAEPGWWLAQGRQAPRLPSAAATCSAAATFVILCSSLDVRLPAHLLVISSA